MYLESIQKIRIHKSRIRKTKEYSEEEEQQGVNTQKELKVQVREARG